MQIGNTPDAWGVVQQVLHWVVAVAVLTQVSVGLIFSNLPEGDPSAGTYYGIHGTLGVLILATMLFRFLWRQINPVPVLPDTLSPPLKVAALANHWLFYVLLIALPIGGWVMVSARGYKISFFGTELPALMEKNPAIAEIAFILHAGGAFFLIGLIILHAAAALRHEFVLKDDTLRRMTPLPRRRQAPQAGKTLAGRGHPR
jgi:cytochrome b561